MTSSPVRSGTVNRIVLALLVAAVLLPITALLGRVDVDAQQGQYRVYVPGIAMDQGELAPASTPTPAAVPQGWSPASWLTWWMATPSMLRTAATQDGCG